MQVRGDGLVDGDATGPVEDQEVTFVLHPNCAVEEM